MQPYILWPLFAHSNSTKTFAWYVFMLQDEHLLVLHLESADKVSKAGCVTVELGQVTWLSNLFLKLHTAINKDWVIPDFNINLILNIIKIVIKGV